MNRTSKIMLAVGVSAALGTVLGALYAPESGYATRRKLMKKGKKLAGVVNDSIDEGMESLEEIKGVLEKQLDKVNRKLEAHKL